MLSNVDKAVADSDSLRQQYEGLLNGPTTDDLDVLCDQLRSRLASYGRVSFNAQPDKLLGFLSDPSGVYKNVHMLIAEGEPQPFGYETRRRIDRSVFGDCGEQLVYGSLNLGNSGNRYWGDYCVVLRQDSGREQTSFIANSTYGYVWQPLIGLGRQVTVPIGSRATWDNVYQLMIIKFGTRLIEEWRAYNIPAINTMVCGFFDCIEAQICHPITIADIQEVRVHQTTQLQALLAQDLPAPMPGDQELKETHDLVLRELGRRGIRVIVSD